MEAQVKTGLIQSFKANSNASTIELQNKGISNLEEILPELQKFKKLNELNLKDNQLENLPELSGLISLKTLDIQNNPIDLSNVVEALKNTEINHLKITVQDEEEIRYIFQELPQLEYINDKKIFDEIQNQMVNQQSFDEGVQQQQNYQTEEQQHNYQSGYSSEQKDDYTLTQQDLHNAANLYDRIRKIYSQDKQVQKGLQTSFEEHIRGLCSDLKNKLQDEKVAERQALHCILAKYQLYEICFDKFIQYFSIIDQKQCESILKSLHDEHALLFKNLSIYSDSRIQEPPQIIQNNINNEMREHWIQENQELREQIASLKQENEKYLQTIIKHSKKESTISNNVQNYVQNNSQYSQQQQNYESQNFSPSRDQLQYSHQGGYSSKPALNATNIQNQSNQSLLGPTVVRTLTMAQLKSMIDEIYVSKQKYDQKYLEAKLPRETMEQHMYTYLNQKYGLKNLIIEWATAIINGIRAFSSKDNDIAVFGKILRNESDEEFRYVQSQVKNTISELLKMYLRGRYPFKHNNDIKDMMKDRMKGFIYEEESIDIIKYMYNQEDSNTLIGKLQSQFIEHQRTPEEMKKLSREEQLHILQEKEKRKIKYDTFQKIILDFQLKSHEKFLSKFTQLFRQVDLDLNGIINEEEFRQLLASMNIDTSNEERVQYFLNQVDPYNHEQITFSQCVTLFSSEIVKEGQSQFSILQKISMENQF